MRRAMPHSIHAPAATFVKPPDTIAIRQRAGIWRVSVNGDFHGDYTRKYWAIDSALRKADEISAEGGAAIVTTTLDGRHDALLYDTRSPRRFTGQAPRAKPSRKRWWDLRQKRAGQGAS